MQLKLWTDQYSLCQVEKMDEALLAEPMFFVTKTAKGIAIVCPTQVVPKDRSWQEDGWRMFSLAGQLVYTLMGILGKIATILGNNGIGVYVISSPDNIYFLVREDDLILAKQALEEKGYFFKM